jgi:cell division transport system permease protein
VKNIQTLSGHWDGSPRISVYVRPTVSPSATLLLAEKLKRIVGVKSVDYISPDAGLEAFKSYSGFGDALKLLSENPLPAVYVISPVDDSTSGMTFLSMQLRVLPEVEFVQMDMEWVKKLQQIMNMARQFVFIFANLMGLGVVLNIGNTIRLAIENRRGEIVVIKLMGATDAFVRRPFLYTGMWFGLLGGVLACLLTLLMFRFLSGSALELAVLYQSTFKIAGLDFSGALLVMLLGGVLGWIGSWLAVARHLSRIQPH